MSFLFDYKDVPKTMPKKETEKLLGILKELRRHATMKNAHFGGIHPEADMETDEIKRLTKEYRQAWLVDPLDEVIERYEDFLTE